ncbi:MAG: hypothetical protein J5679_00230 [Alphaproteobacteria bacterium]|nr:hypothetical protein [Alphaproteobacteria bacterium]
MKKLVSVLAILAVSPAFAASKAARPSYLTRGADGAYDVTYSYTDKVKSGWYGSVRAAMNFLNWENKYYVEGTYMGNDKYSFEPVFSFDIAFGKKINYFWRAEVEAGYLSKYSDKDEGYEITLSTPYIVANGYYDFTNGLYVGAGLGIAMPTTELIDEEFKSGNSPMTSVSPMGGLMFGFAHQLDDNLVLDLRYRIAGYMGHAQERQWVDDPALGPLQNLHLKNEIGFILDNSISLGIRYEF